MVSSIFLWKHKCILIDCIRIVSIAVGVFVCMVDGIKPYLPAVPPVSPIPLAEVHVVVLYSVRQLGAAQRHRLAHVRVEALDLLVFSQICSSVELYLADARHAHRDELTVHVELLYLVAANCDHSRDVLGLRHARVPSRIVSQNEPTHVLSTSRSLFNDYEAVLRLCRRCLPVVAANVPRRMVEFGAVS